MSESKKVVCSKVEHTTYSELKKKSAFLHNTFLMTAKSLPQQKETVVALIVNMLVEE